MSDLPDGAARERWRRADEILGQALEASPHERAALLATCCGDDVELRREVESLLLADERAGGFLETAPPASGDATAGEAGAGAALVPVGTVLADRYRIEGHVGQGGMGAVYRARDLVLETDVAVKVLAPRLLARPEWIEAFRREVRLARLVTHPHVCRVHDIVSDGPATFITMEYVHGESLAARLHRDGQPPLAWCLGVLADVLQGLAAAHAAGVVHRDLKPANVLLRHGSDEAVVADFGVAAEAAGRDGSARAGTRGYMAPEQLAGAPPDARSDLFSFGVLAYRAVTGRMPGEEPAPQLPPGLAGLVHQCLEADPQRRPPDAATALRRLAPPVPARTRPAVRRLAVAGLLATALATVPLWRTRPVPVPPDASVVVAAGDAAGLAPRDAWLGQALQRLIVNELIDGWALDARAVPAGSVPPATAVRSRLWRDASGRLQASVALPRGGRSYEAPAGSLRELAEALASRVAQASPAGGSEHPTPRELQEVGAHDPEAWRQLRRARRAARMQSWELVRALARDAIRRDPGFVMAWLELDLTFNKEDQARRPILDKVIELGDRAQGLNPLSQAGVEFARRSRQGDEAGVARALENLGALPLEGTDLLYVKTRLALIPFALGDPESGVPGLEWVAERWPQDAAADKQLANYYLGGDDSASLNRALRHARRGVELAPEDVAARADLALALLLSGDEAAARGHLAILASADPEDKQDASVGEQDNRVFELHMALGEREEAAADARRLMLGSGMRHAQGQAALAAVDLSRGAFSDGLRRLGAAAEEYEALHVDSLALDAHWQHAWQAYALGRREEVAAVARHVRGLAAGLAPSLAAGHARRVLALDRLMRGARDAGDSGAPRQFEVIARYQRADWAGAARAYAGLDPHGSSLAVIPYAAPALERLGRRDEAQRLYERFATHPYAWRQPYPRGRAWLRLGVLRQERGDRDGARKAFETLLHLWDRAPRDTPEIREAERRRAALGAPLPIS